jgi:quercetin 2,3-dioxygenase
VHQDVEVSVVVLSRNEKINYSTTPARHVWLQVVRGKVTLNGTSLSAGDGAAIRDERTLDFTAMDQSELLLFNLA